MSITEFLRNRPKSQSQKDWEKMKRDAKKKSSRPVTLEELQEQYKQRKKILKKIEELNAKDGIK